VTSPRVVILGGGLAGLTLALQLRQRLPSAVITVLERNTFPVPVAAHKVGESTVEIGAHYLASVIGLENHLREAHLKKFGFRFFFSDGRSVIEDVTELGASDYLRTPGFQIDRGVLENHLATLATRHRIELLSPATVREVELEESGDHHVNFDFGGTHHRLAARWVIDASGRAGLLRRKMDLQTDNGHHANAVWFRVDTRIRVDDWSDDAAWHARCVRRERWLSTNHLVGPGYWVWLIPLPGGAHSIGIVADAAMHPLRTMNSFERAIGWLGQHQPRMAAALKGADAKVLDFIALRHFSYGCRRVFSANRWALTGEAGLFLDPFYSPGTDFIAISNTYICELVELECAGQSIEMHAGLYEQFFFSFYDSTLALYRDQYPLFGHPEVMPVKVIWDYTYYWGVLAQFFFQHRLSDLVALARLKRELMALQAVNVEVQRLLRLWAAAHDGINSPRMLDQAALPWFAELNGSLTDTLDYQAFIERLRDNCALLGFLAVEIRDRVRMRCPDLDMTALEESLRLLPQRSRRHGELLFPAAG
jgi:flavin-dependent dehydrogenase